MKFGIRTPSLKGKISARLSPKRFIRNNLRLKAPQGMGFLTNPKKAVYNRVYNRTSVSAGRLFAGASHAGTKKSSVSGNTSAVGCGVSGLWLVAIICLFAIPPLGVLLLIAAACTHFLPRSVAKRASAKASALFAVHKYQEAIDLLAPIHEKQPTNLDITRLLGIALHDGQRFAEALPLLKEYVDHFPNEWQYSLLLADCCFQTGKYDEAVAVAQKIPEQAEHYYIRAIEILGVSFYRLGKSDLAIETLKRAPLLKRNLDGALMEIHYNLGIILEDQGNKKEALRHFNRVYSQDASYADVAAKIKLIEAPA